MVRNKGVLVELREYEEIMRLIPVSTAEFWLNVQCTQIELPSLYFAYISWVPAPGVAPRSVCAVGVVWLSIFPVALITVLAQAVAQI